MQLVKQKVKITIFTFNSTNTEKYFGSVFIFGDHCKVWKTEHSAYHTVI